MLIAGMGGVYTDMGAAEIRVVAINIGGRDAKRLKSRIQDKIHSSAGYEKFHVVRPAEIQKLLQTASDLELSLDKFDAEFPPHLPDENA
jgi:hypothetical protein